MALSEQERKLLEQLEASLMAEDPQFAETLRGTSSLRVHRRRATLAGIGFVVGLVLLVVGVQVHPVVSVLGFVAMLGAAIIGVNSWQRVAEDPEEAHAQPGRKPSSQEFMEKLEERWKHRHEGDS